MSLQRPGMLRRGLWKAQGCFIASASNCSSNMPVLARADCCSSDVTVSSYMEIEHINFSLHINSQSREKKQTVITLDADDWL